MAEPFINVPWNRPFLPALLDIALEKTGGDIANAFFVFPHARPALYMTSVIREDARVAKPCILPRMESVSGLFGLVRSQVSARHATPVGILDQVALLLGAVRGLREERGGLLRDLPLDDSRRFFPWGVRLAGLMEEFLTHNLVPQDYIHMRDEVTPYAAALLENLGALHARYLASLEERGWTTPGLDAFLTARGIASKDCLNALPALRGKLVILAGFHTLTGAQEVLFRRLWENHGAIVCLHADPKITHAAPHWSCAPLVRRAGAWRTKITPFDPAGGAGEEPEITFRAGYDVHSQLGSLAEELRATPPGEPGPTAIVLPDTNLLLPVLHHLPDTDVNISMGYPLARSPLFRLVESILALQETRRGTGPYLYHWKALIQLLRHPYLKMLNPAPADGNADANRRFRRFLHHAERVARSSRRFSSLADLGARTAATYRDAERAEPGADLEDLFARILRATVFAWEDTTGTDALAASLQGVAELMRERGAALWAHFPIDAECLYRLDESVIPQLAHTALKEERLPPETLFTVLRGLLAEERVPFEAYPLVGDQIMGVLETRLLHFDRVFVADLTDDRLPGTRGYDPLLPESLRPLMGLPGARGRESVAAYNFFRLIHGARKVTLYWQEGVEPQGLNDAKKIRSRFVEELLWREEQKTGRVLAPELPENKGQDGPLKLISCVLPPVPREHRAIPAGEHARKRMRAILEGEISPSLLDSYLRCPARFFHQRIGRISEVEEVAEGSDPMGTGIFLHEVLRAYFAERPGQPVTATDAAVAAMRDTFRMQLASSDLRHTLPADDRIMLEEAAPRLLADLLRNHAGRTPLHLEKKFRAALAVDGQNRTLAGFIDRVDEEAGKLLILDYKTGHVPGMGAGAWQDDEFWPALQAWRPGDGDETLNLVAGRFESVQLPVYAYIVGRHLDLPVRDAAYVPLRAEGGDVFLLGPDLSAAERTLALTERIPLLLSFLLRHMASATNFPPRPSQNCRWCLYKNLCIIML